MEKTDKLGVKGQVSELWSKITTLLITLTVGPNRWSHFLYVLNRRQISPPLASCETATFITMGTRTDLRA